MKQAADSRFGGFIGMGLMVCIFKTAQGWGYCSDGCHKKEVRHTQKLMETKQR